MKTTNTEREVEHGGLAALGSFSIKGSSKAFRILSDGLYTDKPLAVVRELSCNAYDAHVAAGKADVPFVIHLPNALEPFLSVKDFGVGLSHDDVMRLYTTYFESTKTESNDFIGALGLGSKSPFSYVDTFTVISRFNGKRRSYSAFIASNGVPSIALLAEEETEEANGLEVSMPVQDKHFTSFGAAAERALKRFKTPPKIVGAEFELKPVEYVVKGNGWGLRTDGGSAWAVQGNVAYILDGAAAMGGLSSKEHAIFYSAFDLEFQMGELEVAASREGLSYDQRTIANIRARVEQVLEDLPKQYASEFDQCQTMWEAKQRFVEIVQPLNGNLTNLLSSSLEFNGQKIHNQYARADLKGLTNLDGESPDYFSVHIRDRYDLKKMHFKLGDYWDDVSLNVNDEILFYHDDLSRRNYKQLIKNDLNERGGNPSTVVVVRTKSAAKLQAFLDLFGNPDNEIIKVADFPELPKEVRQSISRPLIKPLYKSKGNIHHHDKQNYDVAQHDVTKGGIYLLVDHWQVVGRYDLHNVVDILNECSRLGIKLDLSDVFFIPRTYKTVPEKHKGWVHFDAHLKAEVEKLIKRSPGLLRSISITTAWNKVVHQGVVRLAESLIERGVWPKDKDGPLSLLMKEVNRVSNDAFKVKPHQERRVVLETLCNRVGIELGQLVPEYPTTLPTYVDKDTSPIAQAYPLLWAYFHGYRTPEFEEQWVDYVNLIDSKKE